MKNKYDITGASRPRWNKNKVLGKENRAVLIKNSMLNVFRVAFRKSNPYPRFTASVSTKAQEIEAINKNMELTKNKIADIRNKNGELSIKDTRNLHIYNKHLLKMKKMKAKRENNFVRFEKIKRIFAKPYEAEQSISNVLESVNAKLNENVNENKDITKQVTNELEKSLGEQVTNELNNANLTPVGEDMPNIENEAYEPIVPPINEEKVEAPTNVPPVKEEKVEAPTNVHPVKDEKEEVQNAIAKINQLVEKAEKVDGLEAKVNELTNSLAERDKLIEKLQQEKDNAIKEMQAKENDWRIQIESVRKQLDEITAKFDKLDNEKKNVEQELANANLRNKELEERNNNLIQNNHYLTERYDKLNTFYESVAPVLNRTK
ncbi:MAG TPA: hypothetical protein GXZ95_01475 [Mollicutes bacterium]|nr:hypothetical protein [Mollicutes bacterium]